MKPARLYRQELHQVPASSDVASGVVVVAGRSGEPTIKSGDIFLHSRYKPREEAARLVDSAQLDTARPVLVIGSGLGYHVRELQDRGFAVAVVEPDPAVLKAACEHVLADSDVLVAIGDPDDIASDESFRAFAERIPQVLIHPPTQRLHEKYVADMESRVVRAALDGRRLRVAVVGPLYGGSLPIAGYLERAFRSLGHVTLLVDNSPAWSLYQEITGGVKTKKAANQLSEMFTHFLNEWSYARTAEFMPDICIVMAQAPVDAGFPSRLRKDGIVTAFWYVENWRHFPYWKSVAPYYDCFFHIQPGQFEDELAKAGCPHQAYVPTACDPEVHAPVELSPDDRAEYGCDISFGGAGYPNRVAMFKGLTDYDFKIWGVDWHASELQPLVCKPDQRFGAAEFAKMVAGSKISLNLHSSVATDGVDANADAVNPRVFEIAACGGFQVCDPCKNLESLFDYESELPVYHNLKELRAQLNYYLKHPDERQARAKRARERVLREHTYEHRAKRMLDILLDRYGSRLLRKGVRVQRTMAEIAGRVGENTPLGQYVAKLPPDMLFTHENINSLLPGPGEPLSEAERVFTYLREIRNFAETLLERD